MRPKKKKEKNGAIQSNRIYIYRAKRQDKGASKGEQDAKVMTLK